MRLTLLVLALWAAYVTALHTSGGERRIVQPFRRARVAPPFVHGMVLVVWHMVTWALVTLTAAIAVAAWSPHGPALVILAAAQVAGFTVVFLVTSRRELGAALRLPQWLLLGPLALGLAATAAPRPGAVAAAILVALVGIVHVVWALGSPWPAADREELTAHVFPSSGRHQRSARLPSRAITLGVAAAFFTMSACLVRPGASRWLVLGIALVFAARGAGGLFLWRQARGAPSSPFHVYNRLMYSPCCLLVAALAAASVLSPS
jgi:Protein of unknown function (DUF3995)